MAIWNLFAALSLWLSILTTPAIVNVLIPSDVCDVDSQIFSMPLCALRLSATPERIDLPFGVCDQNHPNFDDNICPKEAFIRAKILFDEMRKNQKRWVDNAKCVCPKEKPTEATLEVWERNTCNQLCVIETWKNLQSQPFCDPEHAEYDQKRCEFENNKLIKPLQEQRLQAVEDPLGDP